MVDETIVMPRLGCGHGGAHWSDVEPVVAKELVEQGLRVVVFDLPT